MANFSTNQAKQLYVASAVTSSHAHVAAGATKGTFALPFSAAADEFYVELMTKGGIVRSDLVETAKISSITGKAASTLTEARQSAYVTCATPSGSQQFIATLKIRQFAGLSDEETLTVTADYTGNSVATVLSGLAIALAKNLSKLAWPVVNVYVTTAAAASVTSSNSTLVTPSSTVASISTGVVAIVIEAADQDYRRGVMAQDNVYFDVYGEGITSVKNACNVGSAFPNSKKIADLEYFCMGERGDIYRGVGFPNNFDTDYLVDPTSANGYDVITIHYACQGTCEDIQASEKDLVIVAAHATAQTIAADLDTVTSSAFGVATQIG